MNAGQREVLDEIIVKIRSGRIKRRTFLERAMTVGLSSSAAISLLEACGGTSNSQGGNGNTVMIAWISQNDTVGKFKSYVDEFNKQNHGIHVAYTNGPADSSQMLSVLSTMLRARSHTYDVMSMDIIWPAEFGANGWTVPISESQWPQSERQKYLQAPLQGCTYNGKLWAAPMSSEPGLLYYRKDLFSKPPATFSEMTQMARSVSPSKVKYGHIWQGAQYEGVVCDFVEVLYSYGGSVLNPNNPKQATINSPEAVQALTEMVSWVGTISPTSVTTYKEDDTRSTWVNGNSAFMRNWPYAYKASNDPSMSKVVGKIDIHTIPSGSNGGVGFSCIGGWNLGINAFSPNPDASWKLMQHLLSPSVQKDLIINVSTFPTAQSVADDPEVKAKVPYVGKVKDALLHGKARPVTPSYPDISDAMQARIHQALTKSTSPASALSALQNDLEAILAKGH